MDRTAAAKAVVVLTLVLGGGIGSGIAQCVSGDVPHRLTFDAIAFAQLDRFVLWDLGPEMFMRVYVNDALTCLPPTLDGWQLSGTCDFVIPEPYDPVKIELELMDSDPPLDDYTVDINAGADKTFTFWYDPRCGTVWEATVGDLPSCPAGNRLPECRGRIRTRGGEAFVDFEVAPLAGIPLVDSSLSVGRMEIVQVTPNPTRVLEDRQTVVRLDLASSHGENQDAIVTVTAQDKAGNVYVDQQTVNVPGCGRVQNVTFFQPQWKATCVGGVNDGMQCRDLSGDTDCPGGDCQTPDDEAGFRPMDGPGNLFVVDAQIDPGADCDMADPPCQPPFDCRIVDGQMRNLNTDIVVPRPLHVKYQPFWRRTSGPCSDAYDAALPPIADAAARPILEDRFPINAYFGETSTVRFLWPLPSLAGFGLIDLADLIDPRPGLVLLDLVGAVLGLDRWVLVAHDSDTGDDRGLQCHWPSMDLTNTPGVSAGANSRAVAVEPEDLGMPRGARVAHEIAHTFGASEAPCPLTGDAFGGITCEDEYNFPGGPVGVPSNGVQVLRWVPGEPAAFRNMNGLGCLMGSTAGNTWIDRYEYEKLLDELTRTTPPGPAVHFRIRLTPDFGGTFLTEDVAEITARPTWLFDADAGREPTVYSTTLRMLRVDGSEIGTVSFTLETVDVDGDGVFEGYGRLHEDETTDFLDAAIILPLTPDAHRIEMVKRSPGPAGTVVETVTDVLTLSSSPVVVDLLAPRSSFMARIGEEYEIRWSALPGIESTSSTVPTRSYVFLSPDEGVTWTPIAAYLPDQSFRWPADADGRFQVRVFATAGFKTADVRGDPDGDLDGCGSQTDPQPQTFDPDGPDMDGVAQICDVCPAAYDPLQDDDDQDLLGDACDNCRLDFNPGQENADGDPLGDACDCATQDPNTWAVPGPVTGLQVTLSGQGIDYADLSWDSQAGEVGSTEVYDVMAGDVDTLRSPGAFLDAFCLAVDAPPTGTTVYRPAPDVGKATWYLLRGNTPCGDGTYDSGAASQAGGRDDLLDQAQGPCA